MMRRWMTLGGLLAVAGCQTANPYDGSIWVRTDGQKGSGNPVLTAQYDVDSAICVGEVQKAAVGSPVIYYQGLAGMVSAAMIADQKTAGLVDIMKGCMAQKGYVLVPLKDAEVVAAEFRRQAAEKAAKAG